MSYGELRVGRWVLRWAPKQGPLPREWIIGRVRRDNPA